VDPGTDLGNETNGLAPIVVPTCREVLGLGNALDDLPPLAKVPITTFIEPNEHGPCEVRLPDLIWLRLERGFQINEYTSRHSTTSEEHKYILFALDKSRNRLNQESEEVRRVVVGYVHIEGVNWNEMGYVRVSPY